MSPAKTWPLRRPPRTGYVGPHMVTCLDGVLRSRASERTAQEILSEARLPHSPADAVPVREGSAALYHRITRDRFGAEADVIFDIAGRHAGEVMLAKQLPARAKTLLKSAPWTISAWMLTRAMAQHAWLFAGSGAFEITDEMRFLIVSNPFARGFTSDQPACRFHASMFETIYSALVDPRLVCEETACMANGAKACQFSFGLGSR